MKGHRVHFTIACLSGLLMAAPPAFAFCGGDCNQDGVVRTNELVTGLNIVLGQASIDECRILDVDCDGQVRIDEMVGAVANGLDGCRAPSSVIVFNGEANNLNAYDGDNFDKQNVIRNHNQDENGLDINAQICFFPDGSRRFIAGEDTGQPEPPQGWGIMQLAGNAIGDLSATKVGKLTPTYQGSGDNAENYGCGFLSDGRVLTTDVGNQAVGPSDGQLILWFPPFDRPPEEQHYCKLDVAIGTAGGIYVDKQDGVYVTSARNEPGVYRYSGNFPTSDDAAGGCGRMDETGAPLVDEGRVTKELFIATDDHIKTASGIVRNPVCGFYVTSVFNGVIGEYDSNGTFVRRVLTRVMGEPHPFVSTGTPFGIGIDSTGTVYYADIGIVLSDEGIGPGRNTGTVRRLRFEHGVPQPPETMDTMLNFPDGIGILEQFDD